MCKNSILCFWRLYLRFFVFRKLSGKRKFSKDNFLPFLLLFYFGAILWLFCGINWIKKVSVLIFLSGLHPHLFPIFRPFSSASREFRDVVTFTTQDRSRRPAEIHCVLGGNKSSRPIAWTWWKSVAFLGEIKSQCLTVRTQGKPKILGFYISFKNLVAPI